MALGDIWWFSIVEILTAIFAVLYNCKMFCQNTLKKTTYIDPICTFVQLSDVLSKYIKKDYIDPHSLEKKPFMCPRKKGKKCTIEFP